MANLRANLNNDDRNRLRNDLVKSTQNAGARSVTGTRSNTRTGALTSNYVKDNTNDLARLKTFLSKYEVTRNIYS